MIERQQITLGDVRQDEAVEVLQSCYAELAGPEALVRALVGARTGDCEAARFWVEVFVSLDNAVMAAEAEKATTDSVTIDVDRLLSALRQRPSKSEKKE